MPDAPEIKVKLTAEDTGVSAAIKELSAQLKNLKKQQDETSASGLSLANAFKGIVAIGGAIEFGRIGKDAFDSAINIGKMADKTGLTTQTLSVFHKVAGDVGVSTEAVDKGLTKAAKSITEFEQGSTKAAKGFQLLGITQKDFAGLKADEKIALVTDRLGKMQAGFAKTTATQLIFAKGGAEMIPVLNSLAAQGFDKATEATSKLGLLLDQTTTDTFRSAKASMQELEDVGKGMATQFEAGLLPAVSDVGEAFVDSLTQGGVSFQDLGKYAGDAVRGIALIFLGLGQTIGTVIASVGDLWSAEFDFIRNEGTKAFQALGQAAHGNFSAAFNSLKAGVREGTAAVKDEVDRQKAIYGSLADSFKADYNNLFPSAEEEERRRKERIKRLRPENPTEAPGVSDDSVAKAQLALLKQQLDQELALYREYAKVRLAVDQRQFEEGKLSLTDYFAARRAEIVADHQKEIQILESQKALEKKEPAKTEAEDIQKKAKIQALDAKIAEAREAQVLKLATLETEEFKKREENQKTVIEFHKLIDTTQGKAIEAAKAEIAIEQQKLKIVLAQSGASQAEIDKELARYAEVKTAEVTFTEQQKDGAAALKLLEDQKAAIQDKVANGKLFQVQADQQILDLYRNQLPQLQQIATQLKENAHTEEEQARAADFQKSVDKARAATNTVGQNIAELKQSLQGGLEGGFANLFTNLISGTQSVGQAFKNLAGTVIQSLAQVAAQMLATLLVKKLLGGDQQSGGNSGGGVSGLLGGLFGLHFAEGGLIKGPGGPKDDKVPAMLSHGEYVVNADTVSKLGVRYFDTINRGIEIPSISKLALPKFAEGGLVGNAGGGGDSNINLGISLEEGLILKHLSSKAAANIVLQHLSNNPKAAQKALSRSD